QDVIDKALQREPRERYQSIAEMRAELSDLKHQSESKMFRARQWIAAAGISAVLALLLGWLVFHGRNAQPKTTAAVPIRSLAVMPLENLSGDAAQNYFADGITDELISRLSRMSELRVISRSSVMRYADTRKSIPEIGRELHVEGMIEGSVMRFADRV